MRLTSLLFLFLAFAVSSFAQQPQERGMDNESESGKDGRPQPKENKVVTIKKSIKTWHLTDDYTFADSLSLDSMITGFQIQNPVLKRNPFSLHTGNLGGPSHSMLLSYTESNQDFIFLNSLSAWFPDASSQLFYNTTVPYTNITYSMGSPKRSEDNIKILFTQNVNRKLNIGFTYNLMSSVGRYLGQQMDNEMSRLFTSYDGEKYSVASSLSFNRIDHHENGGVSDVSYILDPTSHANPKPNNIPVNFKDAKNKIQNTHFFLTQKLGIGRIPLKDTSESAIPLPVGVIFHTLDINTYKRLYKIDNLSDYYSATSTPFYGNLYTDTLKTRDTSNFTSIKNIIQLKFSEEANTLLRFGARAFILNDVMIYQSQLAPTKWAVSDGDYYPYYRHEIKRFVNTAIGGQIFKNKGENFWWNAGFRTYIQGFKTGDSELSGNINSRFRVGKDTAGVFATADIELRSPSLFFEQYYSNHLQWNDSFNKQKVLKVKGGIRIPTKRFELLGEVRLINNYFYWNTEALPTQSTGVIQALEINLNQSFKAGIFNSINRLWWQATSDDLVLPLPTFSGYSSNFIESVFFKVLRFQIGFDITYHTAYYAQAYMPATGQFYVQHTQKTGDYPFADAFVNLHLKRARIGLKFEHVNNGLNGYDYFILPNYPANPRCLKICVSWNFFD